VVERAGDVAAGAAGDEEAGRAEAAARRAVT
jgi:hypothetical protein